MTNPLDLDSAAVQTGSMDDHERWVAEIILYEKDAQKWIKRSKEICKRYKDERNPAQENTQRYNILWSNVQTLLPCVYARNPKVDIQRRFKDKDDLGRITADVLERSTEYFVNSDKFGSVMRSCVLDRLLAGRGTLWVRYEPHFRDMTLEGNEAEKSEGEEISNTVYPAGDDIDNATENQEVYYEEVGFDYVHWQDYMHTIARTESEVVAKGRIVFMTRKEMVARFGEIGNKIPLDYTPKNLKDMKIAEDMKKATIYEIWDEVERTVIWLHKDYPHIIQQKSDPLELTDFYPCPNSLLATTANDSLIPVPDFVQYQDQAKELDVITSRIEGITKAIKVVGVYAASAEGLEGILASGNENLLVAVEQWAMFAEQGGLKGVFELFPMEEIAQTLLYLYEARDKVKSDLYEITGIADVIRGNSDPKETAAAQQLKGQYATIRLSSLGDEIQRFARDTVRIAAQIIAKHFSIDTIKKISGVVLLTNAEKQLLKQFFASQQPPAPAPQPQQQPNAGVSQPMPAQAQGVGGLHSFPTPPMSPAMLPPNLQKLLQDQDELQTMMKNPSWEEVEALLRDDVMLAFKIDIETDSTMKMDEEADKASRVELIKAVGSFITEAQQVVDPAMKVLLAQLLAFGVRGYKAGKDIETALEIAVSKMEKEAQNPPPPPPNPAQIEANTAIQVAQIKAQSDQQKTQSDAQIAMQTEQLRQQNIDKQNQLEDQRTMQAQQAAQALEQQQTQNDMETMRYKAGMQAQLDREKMQNDLIAMKYKTDAEVASKERIAMVGHAVTVGKESDEGGETNKMVGMMQEHMKALHDHLTKPKSVKVTRNADGSLVGVSTNG